MTAETDTEVTVTTLSGGSEVYRRKGLIFVTFGSLSHFNLLHTDHLRKAFEADPSAVFEQALVDARGSLNVRSLKERLIQVGLPSEHVEDAWKRAKKTLDESEEVKVTKSGSLNNYLWKGEQNSRLSAFIPLTISGGAEELVGQDGDALGLEVSVAPEVPEAEQIAPQSDPGTTPSQPEPSTPGDGTFAVGTADVSDGERVDSADLLLSTLRRVLGDEAPHSVDAIPRSVLQFGSALSKTPEEDLGALADVPDEQRLLVTLLLVARDREIMLWPDAPKNLDPVVARAALEAALDEASRSVESAAVLLRFVSRVLDRTSVADLPFLLVANAFVKSAAVAAGSKPSKNFLLIANALAARTKASVVQEWIEVDPLILDISRGMTRLPLDQDGPRSRFLAALFEIRRKHLDGELLWKGADIDALDLAAGGAMRRALQDPDISERVVRSKVEQLIKECATRRDLGKLVALRGAFAKYIEPNAIIAVMQRVAKEDPKANEWYVGLRQQEVVNKAEAACKEALEEANQARGKAEEAVQRFEKAIAERDSARAALNQAAEANAEASDAQLRQAKLDVLRTLASLAVTIKGSAAIKDDPSILQRVDFALRREGLTAIADSGDSVSYDPALHDAQGNHVETGAQVSVGRAGYSYDLGEETLVLLKAHVSVV